MNNTKPPFDNVNVRKAFAHAFNYKGFIPDILRGYATRNPGPHARQPLGHPEGRQGLRLRPRRRPRSSWPRPGAEGAPIEARRSRSTCSRSNEQTCRRRSCFQSELRRSASTSRSWATSGRNLIDASRQARDHARHVGALGLDLLRRSRELGRPDVRQPVPRHLEGVGLLQERQGRRAAAQGARRWSSRPSASRSTRRRPADRGRLPRHLDLQHRCSSAASTSASRAAASAPSARAAGDAAGSRLEG